MNASARPTIGVVEAPDLAHALTLLGFSVVGGGDFRASALAIRSDPNATTAPVITFDAIKPGLRAWIDNQIIGGSRVVVLRGTGTGSIPPDTGVNLQLPVTVNDVLAQAGWGASPHPLGQATVTAEGRVPDLALYVQAAPAVEPEVVVEPEPVQEQPAAPAFTPPPAPEFEQPAEPAFEQPAAPAPVETPNAGLPDWMNEDYGISAEPVVAEVAEQPQAQITPVETPIAALPDWMNEDYGVPATPAAQEQTAPEQPAGPPVAPVAALPDWMSAEFGAPEAPAEPAVQPQVFEQPPVQQHFEAPVAEPANQPAWAPAEQPVPPVAAQPVYVPPVATPVYVAPASEEELDFDAMVAQASGASFQTFQPAAPAGPPAYTGGPPAYTGGPPAYQPPAQAAEQAPPAYQPQPQYDPFAQPSAPAAPVQAPYNPFQDQQAQQPQAQPQPPAAPSKYVDPAAQGPAAFGTEQFNADYSAPAFAAAASPGLTFGGGTGGKVIVSFAGKGGVGKTSCALAMAQRASEAGLRVAVVDMNRGQGDVRTFLRLANPNLPSIYNSSLSGLLEDAVLSPQQINDSRHPNLPKLGFALVLAPPPELADPRVVTAEIYRRTIEFLKTKVDLVIVDTQIAEAHDTTGLIENLVIPSLIDGAWGLGVTDMSSAGLNNLLGRVKKFATHGVDRKHMLLAVNKAASFDKKDQDSVQELFGAYATFAGAAGADLDFANQLNVGIVDVEATALRPLIDHVLLTVTGNEAFTPQTQRRRGLFGRRK